MDRSRARQEDALARQIEGLIDAWIEVQDKQRQLSKFQEDHHSPEPPQEFNNVSGLIEFNIEKSRYETTLRGYRDRLMTAERAFVQQGAALLTLLPEGVPLIYQYQGYGMGPMGKRFKIVPVSSDDERSLQVEELAG